MRTLRACRNSKPMMPQLWECLFIQVLPAPPHSGRRDVASRAWTTATRYGTSWLPGGPASLPGRPACPPTAPTGVPGLRREEVALLAGVSVDYYTQMERGNLHGVSDSVLDALAGALQLDEAERAHLFDLARTAATPARPRRRSGPERVRPSVQRLLDAMEEVPAYVRTGRLDILGVNRLGSALVRAGPGRASSCR